MDYLLEVTPAEAVAAGAQLLDDKIPGWWRQISLSELKLADCRGCVCGQLAYDSAVAAAVPDYWMPYERTLAFLNLRWVVNDDDRNEDWEADYLYGFNVLPFEKLAGDKKYDEYDLLAQRTFKALEREWQKVIEARLQADQLAKQTKSERKELTPA